MTLDIRNVVINCSDPHRLATFWARALDMEVWEDHGTFVLLGRAGSPTTLGLQHDPDAPTGGSRVHVDLGGEPREVAARRLAALGATVVGEERPPGLDLVWTVMADPDGNAFCLTG